MMWLVAACDDVMWFVATCGDVIWLVAACDDVMWLVATCGDVIWLVAACDDVVCFAYSVLYKSQSNQSDRSARLASNDSTLDRDSDYSSQLSNQVLELEQQIM